jgi:hypothetical protein
MKQPESAMTANQFPVFPAERPSWKQRLLRQVAGLFVFEAVSGLAMWLLPFSISIEFMVLFHTAAGLVFVVPFAITQFQHFPPGWRLGGAFQKWLGIAGCAVVALVGVSGLVVTFQAGWGIRVSYFWHYVHLVSGLAAVPLILVHATPLARKIEQAWVKTTLAPRLVLLARELYLTPIILLAVVFGAVMIYSPVNYLNFPLPSGYLLTYGGSPFAPSLATTDTGRPVAPVALNNSKSCGATNCHTQIYDEWAVGAHRWSASDPFFQGVQKIMAREEGAHATRYCAGCHDPISLLTGYKDSSRGLSAPGFDEGASCLTCHGIKKVDVQGNGNFVWQAPKRYAFENKTGAVPVFLSEFLIRAYPVQHRQDFDRRLSQRPEFCAACHKQFIDKLVNKFGWVQLQNQYDDWKGSHWFRGGDPARMLICQQCHMRLVDSNDPGRGNPNDPLRGNDNKHRSHRILAANQFVPLLLKLEGAREQVSLVEEWLRGEAHVPEIENRWAKGPAVPVTIVAPAEARPGQRLLVRVNVTNNKAGHSFPTGPLDLIESWVEFVAKDESGRVVYHSGVLDENGYAEPGTFEFKSEGIDQYGRLIDRHNLWQMVGARFKRAIFPGYTDSIEYALIVPRSAEKHLQLSARLRYRKLNQLFVDRALGKGAFHAPITDLSSDSRIVLLSAGAAPTSPTGN